MTNLEKIRNMSELELTTMLLCPYDASKEPIPCSPSGVQASVTAGGCAECIVKWLKKEVSI